MATQIKLRRDTAANWLLEDPILGDGEPGFELVSGKLKIGDGTSTWSQLGYIVAEPDGTIDLGAVDRDILPATDNTYDIGSPDKRWKHGYFANGSLYVGDIKLSNNNGTLLVQQVTDAGLVTEAPVNTPGVVTTDRIVNGNHTFSITSTGGLELDGSPFIGSGSGLPSNAAGVLTNDGNGTLTWSGVSELSLTTQTLDSYVAFNQRTNPTLTLGPNTGDVTITQAASNVDHPGGRAIRIQGARGYGNWSNTGWGGNGGDIQIYAGLGGESGGDLAQVGGGEGGNIEIISGDGQAGRDGGDLTLRAGQARMSSGSPNNVTGGHVFVQAGHGTDSNTANKGFGGNVYIEAGQGNAAGQHGNVTIHTVNNDWIFDQEGPLVNNGSYTKTTTHNFTTLAPEVVWTGSSPWTRSAKLLIQVECSEDGSPIAPGWDIQTAEAVIAYRGAGEPIITVYGVTYTSTVPLMTFTVQRNPTTTLLEVVATRTAATTDATPAVRVYSVETATTD